MKIIDSILKNMSPAERAERLRKSVRAELEAEFKGRSIARMAKPKLATSARKGVKKAQPKKAETKTAAPKNGVSKADFIRSNAGMKASELVAKAAAEGIVLTTGQINTTRSNDRKRAKAANGKPSKKAAKALPKAHVNGIAAHAN